MGMTISYLQRASGRVEVPDDPNLKGIARIFNTTTVRGRSNISVATLSAYIIAVLYFVLKKKGNTGDQPDKP
ncbi:UNVERIFIED_CONTAM: hypothetical protein PYX00_003974 [Menopon gallinae]|uniref:Uncharacterized protein n=1 Tax=Menopon gallinae TaxID=328185 RepID=A0AAW2I3H9_9NEOP